MINATIPIKKILERRIFDFDITTNLSCADRACLTSTTLGERIIVFFSPNFGRSIRICVC